MTLGFLGAVISIFLSYLFDQIFLNAFDLSKISWSVDKILGGFKRPAQGRWCLICNLGWWMFLWISKYSSVTAPTAMMQVTDTLSIPSAVGSSQHGSARFLSKNEMNKIFSTVTCAKGKVTSEEPLESVGLVLGLQNKGNTEKILCLTEDINTIVLGSTRSGKTRCLILQTIWLKAHSNGSIVITDPKGELYLYTSEYLKQQKMKVIALDFREPEKSHHYNYMSLINQAVAIGNIPAAIDYTWDLVSVLVGVPKGEPLWSNGESAVIASSILAVAMEAPEEYRNLTNVYYFIANMCKTNEDGQMRISRYFAKLPDEHPARGVFAVAEISPSRTRGSFFGSALATLRLFTNWNIAAITADNEFTIQELSSQPTALFIITPDEKTTFHPLVSLFLKQAYVDLVEISNKQGGRMNRQIDFLCEEFGNCPAIPSLGNMLSVGAGRGLRFTLVLQDYQQLEKLYKNDFENIKGNCRLTVFLQSPSIKTLEELSKRLGTYTCQVSNQSGSVSGTGFNGKVSMSNGVNLQSRPLLTATEIGMIERPYALALKSGCYPGIIRIPDLSQYQANKELGLGDAKHNQKVVLARNNSREKGELNYHIKLWKIWEEFSDDSFIDDSGKEFIKKKKKISFLD